MSRRPDTFIVGAPKCGTTSLYEYLKGHPEIYMSRRKEPEYFARDLETGRGMRYGEDLERYLELFEGARDEKRVGEATTRYLYSREAPRLIHEFQPLPWIVVSVRDPVDMAHSLHGHYVSVGLEPVTDFEEALAAEDGRSEGRSVAGEQYPELLLYRQWARYGGQLSRWLEVFDSRRIHVTVFEDMVADASATMRRLLQFLDVDPGYRPATFAPHNVSSRPRSRVLMSILNAPGPRRVMRSLLPLALRDRTTLPLGRSLRRLNARPERRAPLSRQLRRELEETFAPDVALLGDLVGRDLAALWWKRSAVAAGVKEIA